METGDVGRIEDFIGNLTGEQLIDLSKPIKSTAERWANFSPQCQIEAPQLRARACSGKSDSPFRSGTTGIVRTIARFLGNHDNS